MHYSTFVYSGVLPGYKLPMTIQVCCLPGLSCPPCTTPVIIGCLQCISTKFCWVGKHEDIMKPTNSPTQGHPNPRKSRLKVAFASLFPAANNFSWVGIVFFIGNGLQETYPNQIRRVHPIDNTINNTINNTIIHI